jgi:hypothetical protein
LPGTLPPTRDYEPELPEQIAQSILLALAEDPAARQQSAGALVDELVRL